MTLRDDLAIIHTALINAQHDGADCGDLADALMAVERIKYGLGNLADSCDELIEMYNDMDDATMDAFDAAFTGASIVMSAVTERARDAVADAFGSDTLPLVCTMSKCLAANRYRGN